MGWGSLGTMKFETLNGPLDFSDTQEADFAEHAMIGGKPRLQFLGTKLEVASFNLALHPMVTPDPDGTLKALKDAVDAGDPLDLVVGKGNAGIYAGKFVITSLGHQRVEQSPDGKIHYATVSISLKEWVDAPRLGTSKRIAKATPKGIRKTGKTPPPSTQADVQRETNADGYSQGVGLKPAGS